MSHKVVAILQSCYIPWKGYFDIIKASDVFIILDTVQYTRRDWRNRNKIKTPSGPKWLTIPVAAKGNYLATIDQIEVVSDTWAETHLNQIKQNYREAVHFDRFFPVISEILTEAKTFTHLSEINVFCLKKLCRLLNIDTEIIFSRDVVETNATGAHRLIDLVKAVSGDSYLSGPRGRNYIDEDDFLSNDIALQYMSYDGYKAYPQLHGEFIHELSIVDLVLNIGANAGDYLKTPEVDLLDCL